MAEGKHIFLSYRSIEADFALKLAADLKNAGVRLWMDRLDGIVVGVDWRDAIQQGINDCAGMIAAVSPDYVESEYCKKELARANTLKRPIFPVLLRPVPNEQWPFVIQGVQYEDFTQWRDERVYREHFDKLVNRLRTDAAAQLGDIPNAETRYLTSLIAELESRRGVLEYVELSAEADAPQDVRPKPRPMDEWGFAELVEPSSPTLLPQGEGRSPHPPAPSPLRKEGESHARQNDDAGSPLRDTSAKIPLKSIAEAVEKHPRFVLIGEPGAGKTTTIRRLALEAARKRLDNPRTAPLPLLLYLPQWGEEATPANFVKGQLESKGLKPLVQSRSEYEGMLLYLDGLNEMGGQGAVKAKQLSEWFKSPDAPKQVIVTCRVGDYGGELKLGDTPTVLAQELDDEQIQQIATNYLKDKADGLLARVLPEDEEKRDDVRSLTRLARNPYMMGALTFLYENSPSGDLPSNPGALFQKLARALWKREEQRGTTQGIPFEQAEVAFAKLAFAMIDEDKPIDVPLDYATEKMGFSTLVQVGVNANYVTINGEQVRFYHQLMQEYFAAVELGRTGFSAKIHHWGQIESMWMYDFGTHWDESIIALLGISFDVENKINELIAINPFLAAKCIGSGIVVHETTIHDLVKRLLGILSPDEDDHRSPFFEKMKSDPTLSDSVVRALRDLGQVGISELLRALHYENTNAREVAAEVLGEMRNVSAIPALVEALQDRDEHLRETAAWALGTIGDPVAVPGLARMLLSENSFVCAMTAVLALRTIGSPEAISALLVFLLDEKQSDWLRHVKELAAEFLENTHTSSALAAVTSFWIQELSNIEMVNYSTKERACDRAMVSLKRIGTPEALSALVQWEQEKPNVRGTNPDLDDTQPVIVPKIKRTLWWQFWKRS